MPFVNPDSKFITRIWAILELMLTNFSYKNRNSTNSCLPIPSSGRQQYHLFPLLLTDGGSSDDDSSVFDEENNSSLEFQHRGSNASSTPSIPSREGVPPHGAAPGLPVPSGAPQPGHRSSHTPHHHNDPHLQHPELKSQGMPCNCR